MSRKRHDRHVKQRLAPRVDGATRRASRHRRRHTLSVFVAALHPATTRTVPTASIPATHSEHAADHSASTVSLPASSDAAAAANHPRAVRTGSPR